mgnify:CR=1 FL=1
MAQALSSSPEAPPLRARALLRPGFLRLGVALAASAGVVLLTQAWAESHFLDETRSRAAAKLELYASNVAGALGKYQSVPKLLALHRDVVELFAHSGDPAVQARANQLTETVNRLTGAEDTYFMDADGLTFAASNWASDTPFVGHNFSFRPYFQHAMQGRLGRYFALGSTSGNVIVNADPGLAVPKPPGSDRPRYLFDEVSYELAGNRAHYAVDSAEGHWNSGRPGLGYTVREKGGYFPPAPHDTLHDLRRALGPLARRHDQAARRAERQHRRARDPGRGQAPPGGAPAPRALAVGEPREPDVLRRGARVEFRDRAGGVTCASSTSSTMMWAIRGWAAGAPCVRTRSIDAWRTAWRSRR